MNEKAFSRGTGYNLSFLTRKELYVGWRHKQQIHQYSSKSYINLILQMLLETLVGL